MSQAKIILLLLGIMAGAWGLSSDLAKADDVLMASARDRLIQLSQSLQALQKDQGKWQGIIEADPSVDVMPIILSVKLGLTHPHLREETLQRIFHRQDSATQAWAKYPGGAAAPDVTGMVLYGLKLLGVAESDPRVSRAWEWFRAQGGSQALGMLNRMIAVFGDIIPASGVPPLTPKFLALPMSSPVNVHSLGFGRTGLVPLAIWNYYRDVRLGTRAPAHPLDPQRIQSGGAAFAHPLAAPLDFRDVVGEGHSAHSLPAPMEREPITWSSRLFSLIRTLEPLVLTSADFWAQEGIGWILSRQQPDGTWAGAVQITYFNMLALHEAQLAGVGQFDTQIQAGWRGIMGMRGTIPEGPVVQQETEGPIMDTARVLSAFASVPVYYNTLMPARSDRAVEYLLSQQLSTRGDWLALAPDAPPGGWTFENWNSFYPDTDDTAMVLEALSRADTSRIPRARVQRAISRGLEWLLAMQNSNGGFPVWDRGTSGLFSAAINLSGGRLPEVNDDSQSDVTSRILRALSLIRDQNSRSPIAEHLARPIERACSFLLDRREETSDTSLPLWRGEWMVNYLYGTSEALTALLKTRCWSPQDASPYAEWLVSKQDSSGGWGEHPESYIRGHYLAAAPTLTQTEFALGALIEYEIDRLKRGRSAVSVKASIDRGIRYLLDRVGSDPHPFEHEFTGVYVRGVWYGRYVILPHYEAVRTLGLFLELELAILRRR